MFDLYPNILLCEHPGDASVDKDGNYSTPPTDFSEHCICRAVRNGSGQQINLESGTQYVYNYVVYMPVGTEELKPGTRIWIYASDEATLVAKGQVKSFMASAIGCKLWM